MDYTEQKLHDNKRRKQIQAKSGTKGYLEKKGNNKKMLFYYKSS